MPYSITLTNGNVYAAVADGTINTDSNMILIGKDFAGYGQFIDQNIIRLLESSAAPYRPVNKVLEGQLWYDQTNSALKVAYRAGVGNTAGWTTASPARFVATTGAITNLANIPPSNAAPGDLWYCLGYAGNIGNIARDDLAVIRMNANVSSSDIDVSWPVVGPHNTLSNTTIGNLNANGIRTRYLDVTFFANINNANILTAQSTGHVAMANANVSTYLEIAGILDLNANRGSSNAWIPTLIGNVIRVDGVDQTEEGNVTSYKFLARPPWAVSDVAGGTNWDTTGNVPGTGNGSGFFGNVFGNYVYGSEIGNALITDTTIYVPGVGNISANGGAAAGRIDNQLTVFHGWLANDNWSWRQPFIRSIGANMNVESSTTGYSMNTAIWTDSKSSNVRTANVAWEGWAWGNVDSNGTVISGANAGNNFPEAFSFVTDIIDQYGKITGNVRANTLSNVGYYGPNTWVVANAFVGNLYGAIKGAITKPITANTTTVYAGNVAANIIAFPVGGNVPARDPAVANSAWVANASTGLTPNIVTILNGGGPGGLGTIGNISIWAPANTWPNGAIANHSYAFFDIVWANGVVIWDNRLEVGNPTGNASNTVGIFNGSISVSGNLDVQGAVNYSNTTISEINVASKTIELSANINPAPTGTGIKFGDDWTLLYDEPSNYLESERGLRVISQLGTSNNAIEADNNIYISAVGASFQGQLGKSSQRYDAYINQLSIYSNTVQPYNGHLDLYVQASRYLKVDDNGPGSGGGDNGNTIALIGASGTGIGGTIVCRDGDGVMYGIAAQALYADLAEKYLLDAEYPKGTVVAVGGAAEATACTLELTPFGVISTNPAFKMNGGLEGGEFIALKGRVPTRVVGEIRRGQKLGPSTIPGVATVNESNWIAIALDNYNSDDPGVIEAIVM